MRKILLYLGMAAFVAGSAEASTYVWNGSSNGDWNTDTNWEDQSVAVVDPVFDNAAVIRIDGTINLDQYIRAGRIIKSLEFTSSNTGATAIGLRAKTGVDRDLTFSADSGNATITVDASASGEKTIGAYLDGTLTIGEVVLESDLVITHNGTGSLTFAAGIEGASQNVTLSGTGVTVFSGINTYTGNTTVDSTLTLSDDAQLNFSIGEDGESNTVSGFGTVTFEGDFLLDLTTAGITPGDSWELVDVSNLNETFGETFALSSTNGTFTQQGDVWSISENGIGYTFSQSTGLLTAVPAAYWMSGKWGIGWRFDADDRDEIAAWDVDTLVSQVKSIPGVNHVIFNISDAAQGDTFIAPHSVITAINPTATPLDDRDLFMEMAVAFKAEGIKVIAYIACQGPAMLKHGVDAAYDKVLGDDGLYTSVAMDNWSTYVNSVYDIEDFDNEDEMFKRAFGEVILDEFAARYGTLVDGWWFDNGSEYYDAELLVSIAKKYNPNSVVTTSSSVSFQSDYLNGHPAPVKNDPADSLVNLPKLTDIEISDKGYQYKDSHPNLGHMFMPIGETWNGGAIVWELDQAADWLSRCLAAGGSWTWNVDLKDRLSILRADAATFMTEVSEEMDELSISNLSAPSFTADTIDGGSAEFSVVYEKSLQGTATDDDGDELTYAMASGPDWLEISSDGTLSGTPYNTINLGMNEFTLVVSDGKGHIDIAELQINVTDESGNAVPYYELSFDDLNANLSGGTIDGLNRSDDNVTITKAEDGNDVVYSLSIINQNFDGGDDLDDSLSWDIRVKGFSGGTYTVNENDSSVTLGSSLPVGTLNKEFGVSGVDTRFVNPGESLQFSVENVILTSTDSATAQFEGFDDIRTTAGTYIQGIGSGGLESIIHAENGDLTFPSPSVLTLTASTVSERLRDLDGTIMIYPDDVP